jgi:hypothetical protein
MVVGMNKQDRRSHRSRLIARLAGGLAVAMAVQAGAAERVVLGEYFTSVY